MLSNSNSNLLVVINFGKLTELMICLFHKLMCYGDWNALCNEDRFSWQVLVPQDLGEVYKVRVGYSDEDQQRSPSWLLDKVSCTVHLNTGAIRQVESISKSELSWNKWNALQQTKPTFSFGIDPLAEPKDWNWIRFRLQRLGPVHKRTRWLDGDTTGRWRWIKTAW